MIRVRSCNPTFLLGTIVFCDIAGWLLAYVALPPRLEPGA